jgi:prevent-host-death family protein
MQKLYSISQAQRRFAAVVQEAETDGPIQITQRGKPVAVLLSQAAYEQLVSNRPQEKGPEPTQFDFYAAYQAFRASSEFADVDIDPEIFNVRTSLLAVMSRLTRSVYR